MLVRNAPPRLCKIRSWDFDFVTMAAARALVEARAVRLALEGRQVVAGSAALRANRAILPKPCLKPLEGL
jgi:hypothetical protein